LVVLLRIELHLLSRITFNLYFRCCNMRFTVFW